MGERDREEGAKDGKWLTPATVLLLITGILVPIVAALIPTVMEYFKGSEDNFTYTSSAIGVGNRGAFRVIVRNMGRVAERNVEIWLRFDGKTETMELDLSGAPPTTRVRDESQYKVVSLGDLRPGESAYLSGIVSRAQSSNIGGFSSHGGVKGMFFDFWMPITRIVSLDRAATRVWESRRETNAMEFVYRTGFWMFVIVLLGAVAWALRMRWRRW